jgi:hypothetical protein
LGCEPAIDQSSPRTEFFDGPNGPSTALVENEAILTRLKRLKEIVFAKSEVEPAFSENVSIRSPGPPAVNHPVEEAHTTDSRWLEGVAAEGYANVS